MTVEFDRTAHCQYNHQRLTEFQRILTEQFWLFFDRTTIPTEHLRKLGFDRTVNWKMFCQKNALLGILCHIEIKLKLPSIEKLLLITSNIVNICKCLMWF